MFYFQIFLSQFVFNLFWWQWYFLDLCLNLIFWSLYLSQSSRKCFCALFSLHFNEQLKLNLVSFSKKNLLDTMVKVWEKLNIRHLKVKSRCWYFNEKNSDVLIYDYWKLKVIKRLNFKIAILHHNITISHYHNITISKYWYCNIVISI